MRRNRKRSQQPAQLVDPMLAPQLLHTSPSTVSSVPEEAFARWIEVRPDTRSAEVNGGVLWLLRVEGLAVAAAAAIMYGKSGFGWGVFALFFLAPDISFLGYLAGNRFGAIAYNTAHSYVCALACFSAGLLFASPALEVAGMIWCAHIGLDRAMGYGLKYAAGFTFTHLGRIGRSERDAVTADSGKPAA
jgi:Domain of unknown function (DUF4260)